MLLYADTNQCKVINANQFGSKTPDCLSADSLLELEPYIYFQRVFNTSNGKVLLLSRDIGSGREIRKSFAYVLDGHTWKIIGHSSSSPSYKDLDRVEMKESEQAYVFTLDGKVFLK